MKEFETSEYLTVKRDIDEMINGVNSTLKNLDKTVIKVIEGKTLHILDTADIAQALKNEKVNNVPSFVEQLSFGVDNRHLVKLSEKETEDINSLNEMIDTYSQSVQVGRSYLLQLATVIKGKAVINETGLDHIERQKIRMNKTELDLYNKINELRDFIVNDVKDKFILYTFFKDSVFQSFSQNTELTPKEFKHLTHRHNLDKK